jgi:tRNA(adenine34) deaminase
MNNDEKFIERAIALAAEGLSKGLAPFGAVVVDSSGQIVGEGYNTVNSDFDPSAHGEVVAIRNACANLKTLKLNGHTLYTSCEPCLMCTYVTTRTQISRVVYAARAEDVPGRPGLLHLTLPDVAAWINQHPDWQPLEIVGDVLREKSAALFANYSWT